MTSTAPPPHGQGTRSAAKAIQDWMDRYPTGVRARLYGIPHVLWRLGLGALIGRPLILLTTKGRRSGLVRRTVLMPGRLNGRLYVWCPFGDRGAWFQNLTADPLVTVQTWQGAYAARASRTFDDAEVVALYRMLCDLDQRSIHVYLDREGIDDSIPGVIAAKSRLHIARLDPVTEAGLPPQRADLVWVWPVVAGVAGVAGVAIWLARRRKPVTVTAQVAAIIPRFGAHALRALNSSAVGGRTEGRTGSNDLAHRRLSPLLRGSTHRL